MPHVAAHFSISSGRWGLTLCPTRDLSELWHSAAFAGHVLFGRGQLVRVVAGLLGGYGHDCAGHIARAKALSDVFQRAHELVEAEEPLRDNTTLPKFLSGLPAIDAFDAALCEAGFDQLPLAVRLAIFAVCGQVFLLSVWVGLKGGRLIRRLVRLLISKLLAEAVDAGDSSGSIPPSQFYRQIAEQYGLPGDVLVFDTETTGFKAGTDLICWVGHTLIRNHKPVETVQFMLNWPSSPLVDQQWLYDRMATLQYHFDKDGKQLHHTYARMQAEGLPPLDVLAMYLDLFREYQDAGSRIVAHNGYAFDVEAFQGMFYRFLHTEFWFSDDILYDTGTVERARQLEAPPFFGESFGCWATRLTCARRGIKWSLHGYCEETYALSQKLGLTPQEIVDHAHTPGFDSRMAWALYETQRQLAIQEDTVAKVQSCNDPSQAILPRTTPMVLGLDLGTSCGYCFGYLGEDCRHMIHGLLAYGVVGSVCGQI